MGTLYSVSTVLQMPINSSPRRRRLLVATPMACVDKPTDVMTALWTYFPNNARCSKRAVYLAKLQEAQVSSSLAQGGLS